MGAGTISRGHPLFALLALVAGWIGGRAATWEPPMPQATAAIAPTTYAVGAQSLPGSAAPYPDMGPSAVPVYFPPPGPQIRYILQVPQPEAFAQGTGRFAAPVTMPHLREDFAALQPLPRFYAPEGAGGTAQSEPQFQHPAPTGTLIAPPRSRRWSMDAWALLRRDGAGVAASAGALPATYGASQAGGVLRYRLALTDPHRLTAYIRSTSSTGQLRETSAAVGLSARPLAGLPIIGALEGRVTDQAGRRRVQGAAMGITELPPFALPFGLRGEAYAQAGYVAGSFATLFADGQLRADHGLVTLGAFDARFGGGLWGGAQKGATRLDAGPTASVAMPLGRGLNGRVAVDWRFRVAGDAVPDSGPAVTLSAGF